VIDPEYWLDVRDTLTEARAICWDGCHKIYVLMDDAEVTVMQNYGYDTIEVTDPDEALLDLKDWYERSCFLRFVNAIETVDGGDRNEGFTTLIPQGVDDE